jgi:mono/diheme cytochrome c family protein
MSDETPRQRIEREEDATPEVIPMHHPIMRELDEPTDGFEPTPVWLMLIYFTLIGWGGWYLAMNSGDFTAGVLTDGLMTPGAGAAAAAPPPPADPMTLGRRIYNNCTTCHQADGNGVPGAFPPLAQSEWVLGGEDTLVRILLHGAQGPMTVRGNTYNSEMPAWGQLRDEQIAAVLTFIRASWGNAAAPVEPATVARIREASGRRTQPWTAAELRAAAP